MLYLPYNDDKIIQSIFFDEQNTSKLNVSASNVGYTFYNFCRRGMPIKAFNNCKNYLKTFFSYKDDAQLAKIVNRQDKDGNTVLLRFLQSEPIAPFNEPTDHYIVNAIIQCGADCLLENNNHMLPFEYLNAALDLDKSGSLLILSRTVENLHNRQDAITSDKMEKLLQLLIEINKKQLSDINKNTVGVLINKVGELLAEMKKKIEIAVPPASPAEDNKCGTLHNHPSALFTLVAPATNSSQHKLEASRACNAVIIQHNHDSMKLA